MKKIAIIGASYLQVPLIEKAKAMNLETHVFAWGVGDVGEKIADYFYPISIVEKEKILEQCNNLEIDGICTIASDLAVITVNYVADKMGLVGNDMHATSVSTNKYLMRCAFEQNGDPSPKSMLIENIGELDGLELTFPVIVKPLDRSGSRGITKVYDKISLEQAVNDAIEQGFVKKALIEEFVDGEEYSVEYISYKGVHTFLALTKKYTTGSPCYIETAHLEPAMVSNELADAIKDVVVHALDTLGIKYGASHSEVMVTTSGDIKIVEIGGRMGGDFIGSSLVELSTGVDYVKAVIDVAMGDKPQILPKDKQAAAAVRFVLDKQDIDVLDEIRNSNSNVLIAYEYDEHVGEVVSDSSSRHGYYILAADNPMILEKYLERKV